MSPSTIFRPTPPKVFAALAALLLLGLVARCSWPVTPSDEQCLYQGNETGNAPENGADRPAEFPVDCVSQPTYTPEAQAERAKNHWPEFFLTIGTWLLMYGTILLAAITLGLWLESRSAAKKQRKAERTAHRRELRAYVNIISVDVIIDGSLNVRANVSVTFANFGRTPAKNLRIAGVADVVEWPLPSLPLVGDPRERKDLFPSLVVVGPTAQREWSPDPVEVTWDDLGGTREKPSARALVVWGKIFYDDIFGKPHITEFKSFLGGPFPLRNFRMNDRGEKVWRMRAAGEHNAAD